jgi:osmotically inducible lipoprotein OsmB
MTRQITFLAMLGLALAACGSDRGDRVASGAGIGAGTGAAVGAIFGGVGAIPGALIGAAVGGAGGAVTEKEDVNLGDPVWR